MADIDPIYKTKKGEQVTKQQLIESGYSEERINKGLSNGILSLIGDTNSPSQVFKSKDGQTMTYDDLINSGYSEERINKGVQNGILVAEPLVEKKNLGGVDSGIGGLETSQSEFQLPSPLLEEDFRTSFQPQQQQEISRNPKASISELVNLLDSPEDERFDLKSKILSGDLETAKDVIKRAKSKVESINPSEVSTGISFLPGLSFKTNIQDDELKKIDADAEQYISTIRLEQPYNSLKQVGENIRKDLFDIGITTKGNPYQELKIKSKLAGKTGNVDLSLGRTINVEDTKEESEYNNYVAGLLGRAKYIENKISEVYQVSEDKVTELLSLDSGSERAKELEKDPDVLAIRNLLSEYNEIRDYRLPNSAAAFPHVKFMQDRQQVKEAIGEKMKKNFHSGIPDLKTKEQDVDDVAEMLGVTKERAKILIESAGIPSILGQAWRSAGGILESQELGLRRLVGSPDLLSKSVEQSSRANALPQSLQTSKENLNLLSSLYTVADTFGQVAVFAAEGALGGRLLGALGKAAEATLPETVFAARTPLAQSFKRAGELGATFSSGFLSNYESAYQEALKYTNDETKAKTVAGFSSAIVGVSELLLPDVDIAKRLAAIRKLPLNMLQGGLSQNTFLKALGTFGKIVGVENLEEQLPILGDKILQEGILNRSIPLSELIDESINTAIVTTIGTAPLGLVGGMKNRTSGFTKSNFYEASLNPSEQIKRLNEAFDTGNISEEEKNKQISIVNTLAEINKNVVANATDKNGKPLSEEKKSDLTYNLLQQAVLEDNKKKSLPALSKFFDEDISVAQKNIDGVIANEPVETSETILFKKNKELDNADIDERLAALDPNSAIYEVQKENLETERQKINDYYDIRLNQAKEQDKIELSDEEKINEAKTLVTELAETDQLPDVYKQTALDNPEEFLKFINEQSLDPNTTEATKKQFSETLVSTANEVVPLLNKLEAIGKPKEGVTESELTTSTVGNEAEEVAPSIEETTIPTEDELKEFGETPLSLMDAEKRRTSGDRVFGWFEQDEQLVEIKTYGDYKSYGFDQDNLVVLPKGTVLPSSIKPKVAELEKQQPKEVAPSIDEKFTEIGGNKMVDSKGEPRTFFHFSDNTFTEFKGQNEEGYQRKHSVTNKGIYFHEAEPQAKYGKNKYEVNLKIDNPFVIDNRTYVSDVTNPYTGKKIEVEHINEDDIKYLKEQGYDGVVAKYPSFQTVVFDSSQIKIVKVNGEQVSKIKNKTNEKVIEQTTENQTTAVQPEESTGTETTESETTQGTEETVKNEEKRVSLANEPIAKAAGVSQTEATPKETQYIGQDVIGSRGRPESEKAASRQAAKEKIKSPETNVSLQTANEYNKSAGLPEVASHTFKPSEKILQTEIAELYPKLQDVTSQTYSETDLEREIFESYKAKFPEVISENNITNYKELVEKSYAKLAEEADAQFKALKIKVDFHNGDQNYDSSAEMLDDVHNFGHLWVFQGGEDHTLLGSKTADENGLTANDKFRAVHDYFGHSIEGFEFGKNGEENAWIEHSKMFSPLAQWALSSETRGQNSYVNYSGVNEVPLEKMKLGAALKKKGTAEGNQEMAKDGQKLLDESNNEFSYAEQKSVILPEKYSDASKYFKPSKQSIAESGKALADRIRSLRPSKENIQGTFFGLPIAIYDTALVTVANAIEAGADIAQAIQDGIDYVKSQVNDWKFEKEFRQAIDDSIAGKKPKAIISGDVSKTEEPIVSGIKKALVSEDIIEGVDLDKIGDKEMMALGRKIINSGEVKPQILVNQIVSNKKGVLTPKEVVALITYKADIDRELREAYEEKNRLIQRGNNLSYVDAEISDLEDRITAFDIMAVITANQQSMAFRLRKMMLDRDYNIVTQIEKYKSKNNGYIPPEIEAKFREMAKELDEVKQKLADAEKREEDRAGNEAILDIQEDVQRNPTEGLTKEEIDLIVQAGIEQEINAIREKMPTERKKRADKKIAALEAIQKKLRGKAYDAGLGIPVAIIDAGITVIKNAIKLDVAIRDAVELGINKIKQLYGQTWDKEDDFRKDMLDGFKDEGIDITKEKKEKPLVDENGNISIPNSLIRDLVKRGVTDINDLTDEILGNVKTDLPNVTKRQVRDAITSYGKQVNPTKDEIQKQINTAKRVGRLLSELEDLQSGISGKVKKAVFRKSAITKQEQELKRKIKVLSDALKITPPALIEESNLNNRKAAARRRISELENRIAKKDYGKRPKPPLRKEDTELVHLRTKKEHLQQRFDEEQYRVELKNRTGWQKTGDVLLELVSGLPRALVASIDFSAMLIQGLFRLARHPIQSIAAAKQMFSHFASEKTQKAWEAAIKAQDWFPMLEASGIDLTEVGGKLNAREELFISDWINHIWDGIGWVASLGNKKVHNVWKKINPYKASNRAYVGYLNSVRVNAFLEGANYLDKKGLSFESHPSEYKAWGNYVNTITGRGSLGSFERASKLFSIAFFSPRKIAASLKLFTPYVFVYYAKMPRSVRQKAILDFASSVGILTGATVLASAAISGGDDDDEFWNPTSSDFLTIRSGNTRVDILGGMKQYLVFMSRMFTGRFTNANGIKDVLGERTGKTINTRFDLGVQFVTNKLSPLVSLGARKLQERKGAELDQQEELINHVIPIWMQDVKQLYKEQPAAIATMLNILTVFGAGIRSYESMPRPTSYSPEDLKDPLFKYFTDKEVSIPEPNASSVEIKDEQARVIRKLKDLGEDKIKEYSEVHKKYLKENIQEIIDIGYVYKDIYDRVSTTDDDNEKETIEIDKLTKPQLKSIISILSGKATKQTKEDLFGEEE